MCEIRFANTGVIYGNPYPVIKNRLYSFYDMLRLSKKMEKSKLF